MKFNLQLASAVLSLGVLVFGAVMVVQTSDAPAPTSRVIPGPAPALTAHEDPEIGSDVTQVTEYVEPPLAPRWEYARAPDAIRGGEIVYASIVSDPEFTNGHFHARLSLEMHPSLGSKADIFILGGTICSAPGCRLPLAFDGETANWPFVRTTNGFRAYDSKEFIARIAKSKELIVGIPTSDFGEVQVRFLVENLDW